MAFGVIRRDWTSNVVNIDLERRSQDFSLQFRATLQRFTPSFTFLTQDVCDWMIDWFNETE